MWRTMLHRNRPRSKALAGLAGALALLAPSFAQAADAVVTWNNTLLTIIAATSGQISEGPPEVAREMAIVGTSMYNAAQVASASGHDVDTAVNQAAYNAMLSLYTPHGTQDNPNVNNPNTIGDIFAANTANIASGFSAKLLTQIQTTYANLGGAVGTTPLAGAARDGLNAATDLFSARTGCGTTGALCQVVNNQLAPTDNDGAYASVLSSLTKTNYAAGSGAYSNLAPGASPTTNPDNTLTACGLANTCPGVYLPPSTTSGGHIAITPSWGTVTPFINAPAQVSAIAASVGAPYNIGSAAYAQDLLTTYCTGGVGSTELVGGQASVCGGVLVPTTVLKGVVTSTAQTLAVGGGLVSDQLIQNALFWNDPGTTEQPPGHWLNITDTTILNAGNALSELQQAQLTMLIADGEANAAVATWNDKYAYNLWRPITAITGNNAPGHFCAYGPAGNWNQYLGADNFTCDPGWKSYITTPPHPDFIAGHPAFSGAAATILTDFLGMFDPNLLNTGFSDTSNSYCNTPAAAAIYGYNNGQTYGYASGAITTPFVSGGVLHTTIVGCLLSGVIYDDNLANLNATLTSTGVSASNPGGVFIVPITETFENFIDASQAATDSRVNGGIHTPLAIADALSIGNQIGSALFAQVVPEPSSFVLMGLALVGFGTLRRRIG